VEEKILKTSDNLKKWNGKTMKPEFSRKLTIYIWLNLYAYITLMSTQWWTMYCTILV